MNDFTTLAHHWLESHPHPSAVTGDPERWAEQTGEAIFQRIHQLVEQLAPRIPGEEYLDRLRRLNSAWQTATELAIDEHLPIYDPTPTQDETWVPLIPDISDLL